MEYIERKCTISHEGREFSAGGAIVTPDHLVAYVGKKLTNVVGQRELTDWHGDILGTCYISSTWATPRACVSSTMCQVYATVDGVTYTGRCAGEGMVFRGRKVRS